MKNHYKRCPYRNVTELRLWYRRKFNKIPKRKDGKLMKYDQLYAIFMSL